MNEMPAPPGALTPPHSAATAARTLPVQRSPPDTAPTSARETTLLVADPRPATRVPLSVGLHATGIGRVLNADSVAEVHEVIARGVTGDVALISVEFGPATGRLIHDLHRAGWPRVLVTTPTDDPDPVIHAFLAGASGVLRGPPATPAAATGPLPIRPLTDHEINVIRLVAAGRTNRFIGQRLSLSVMTTKSHLARIGRKLGTGDRAGMVAVAMRVGLIR